MALETKRHQHELEEGLLLPIADEKTNLSIDDSYPGSGYRGSTTHSTHERTTDRMVKARRILVTLVAFLFVSFGLTSVIAAHVGCSRHHGGADGQRAMAGPGADASSELSDPAGTAEPDLLHRLLHAYFPKSLQDGVYASDEDTLSAVEADDAALGASLAQIAKRQEGNNTEPSPTPTPSPSSPSQPSTPPVDSPTSPSQPPPVTSNPPVVTVTSTVVPPPVTPSSQAPPPPPASSTPGETTPAPPPQESTTSQAPPPPPSSAPSSSEQPQAPSTTAPSAAASSNPGTSQAEQSSTTPTSSSEPSTSTSASSIRSSSATTPPTTTTTTAATTSPPSSAESTQATVVTTTSSRGRAQSSSAVLATRTTTDAEGDVVYVTETSYVGVDPSPQTTSDSASKGGNLQDAAPRAVAGGLGAVGIAAIVGAFLL